MTTVSNTRQMIEPGFNRIRTIKSHVGVSRFLAETGESPAGWVDLPREIPSPYASGSKPVFRWTVTERTTGAKVGDELFVVVVETSHKVYEVYAVKPELVRAED